MGPTNLAHKKVELAILLRLWQRQLGEPGTCRPIELLTGSLLLLPISNSPCWRASGWRARLLCWRSWDELTAPVIRKLDTRRQLYNESGQSDLPSDWSSSSFLLLQSITDRLCSYRDLSFALHKIISFLSFMQIWQSYSVCRRLHK